MLTVLTNSVNGLGPKKARFQLHEQFVESVFSTLAAEPTHLESGYVNNTKCAFWVVASSAVNTAAHILQLTGP
jgi:hypothetical protein